MGITKDRILRRSGFQKRKIDRGLHPEMRKLVRYCADGGMYEEKIS